MQRWPGELGVLCGDQTRQRSTKIEPQYCLYTAILTRVYYHLSYYYIVLNITC